MPWFFYVLMYIWIMFSSLVIPELTGGTKITMDTGILIAIIGGAAAITASIVGSILSNGKALRDLRSKMNLFEKDCEGLSKDHEELKREQGKNYENLSNEHSTILSLFHEHLREETAESEKIRSIERQTDRISEAVIRQEEAVRQTEQENIDIQAVFTQIEGMASGLAHLREENACLLEALEEEKQARIHAEEETENLKEEIREIERRISLEQEEEQEI